MRLEYRISKIEDDVQKAAAIREFIQEVTEIVAQADPKAAGDLSNLVATREAEFIKSPATLIDTLIGLINNLGADVRSRIIQEVARMANVPRKEKECAHCVTD